MASTSRRRRGAGNRRRAGGQVWPSPGEQGRINAVPSPSGPANASYRRACGIDRRRSFHRENGCISHKQVAQMLERAAWAPTGSARKPLNLKVVRKGGLEPPRYCYRQPLKLVRLPIPPLPRVRELKIVSPPRGAQLKSAAGGEPPRLGRLLLLRGGGRCEPGSRSGRRRGVAGAGVVSGRGAGGSGRRAGRWRRRGRRAPRRRPPSPSPRWPTPSSERARP